MTSSPVIKVPRHYPLNYAPYYQTTISWNLTVGFCFHCLELSSNRIISAETHRSERRPESERQVLHTAPPAVAGAGVATAAHGMRWHGNWLVRKAQKKPISEGGTLGG